ncbi:MAG: CBS domain-containing protein [Methanomicrobiaceae archaeon]|nr:CBS domain-containing protein [Methanomicrobiaceae archaeon]
MELSRVPVTEIMRREFEHVLPETPLDIVLEKFSERGRHGLIVLDDAGRFAGVILLTDLLSCINPHIGIPSRRRGHGIMCILRGSEQMAGDLVTRPHLAIPQTATLEDALGHMAQDQHPYLVVTDDAGIALGCLELSDIILFLRESGIV